MAHIYHHPVRTEGKGALPSLLGPCWGWESDPGKDPSLHGEPLAPHLEHPQSVSGKPLALLFPFPQNAQEERTAEAPNPRPDDAQSRADQPLGHDTRFPPIQGQLPRCTDGDAETKEAQDICLPSFNGLVAKPGAECLMGMFHVTTNMWY